MSQKVLVAGTGISGIAAAKLLLSKGGEVVLYDGNEKLDPEELKKKFDEGATITFVLGELKKTDLLGVELAILSPGIPTDAPFVEMIRETGIPIWGEMQLAYHCAKGRMAAITGTNGKTTTTSLTGEIMRHFFNSVFVVGNIGEPFAFHALETTDETVTVAEVSSFMLETMTDFHPNVSAILNITPDHLNRHHTMENYIAAKEAITMNQTKDDYCILNYENAYTSEFGEKRCPATVVFFSSARRLDNGLFYEGEDIYLARNGEAQRLLNVKTDMNLVGVCNIENVMAAIGIATSAGVPMENILSTIKRFKAVEHRIEYVATKNGVVYYNDSKGTNPDAAIQGIKAMDRPTVLIGGGYDKGSEYDEWIESFDGKVKKLVLLGQTREKIAECARKHNFQDICFADTFEEAMDICVKEAKPGDAVLLSPACASWGMFDNYEQRGRIFKDLVNNL